MLRFPRVWVLLTLTGDKFDPDTLGRFLQWNPNFLSKESDSPYAQFHSTLSPDAPLEEHVWEILKKISPKKKEWKKLCIENQVSLYVSAETFHEESSSIFLEARTLLLLGDIGIRLEWSVWKKEPPKDSPTS